MIWVCAVYTLTLAGLAQWTVRQSAEVENQMTAVERIDTYSFLPPESGYVSTLQDQLQGQYMAYTTVDKSSPTSFICSKIGNGEMVDNHILSASCAPVTHNISINFSSVATSPRDSFESTMSSRQAKGHLEIKNLTVTYRDDLPPVLRSLSVNIWGGCKAGISRIAIHLPLYHILRHMWPDWKWEKFIPVGTSSSKYHHTRRYSAGRGVFDKHELGEREEPGRHYPARPTPILRNREVTIPDHCVCFSIMIVKALQNFLIYTVRFNLDPFGIYSDQQLWEALNDAHIKDHISSSSLGLSTPVEEGGKNFSVGQRQLLSLARAIVRRSRVVLMDEVTASIDYVTDQLIQSTIRTSDALKHATIVTVAHRLRTIADSDMIVVINAGECVEQGTPSELLKNSDSYFRKLAIESNEFDDILRISIGVDNN